MARLPKAIIKKYGITKKAWAVYRRKKGRKKTTAKRTTRRKTRRKVTRSRSRRRTTTVRKRRSRKRGFSIWSGWAA